MNNCLSPQAFMDYVTSHAMAAKVYTDGAILTDTNGFEHVWMWLEHAAVFCQRGLIGGAV